MELIVKMMNGTTKTLMVQPHDTVGSLKTKIKASIGVDTHKQKLVYSNGQNCPLNDDSRPLSSYGLQSGSQVSLLIVERAPPAQPTQPATIQVFLRNEKGQTKPINEISPHMSVNDFKKKVQSMEGVAVSQQRLIHEGREMNDGRLSDYGVKALSTIYLTLRLRGG